LQIRSVAVNIYKQMEKTVGDRSAALIASLVFIAAAGSVTSDARAADLVAARPTATPSAAPAPVVTYRGALSRQPPRGVPLAMSRLGLRLGIGQSGVALPEVPTAQIQVEVREIPFQGTLVRKATLKGQLAMADPKRKVNLVVNVPIDRREMAYYPKLDASNRFEVSLELTSPQVDFEVSAVDSRGTAATERFRLSCPDCFSGRPMPTPVQPPPPIAAAPPPPPPPVANTVKPKPGAVAVPPAKARTAAEPASGSGWAFTPALGVTQLAYGETNVGTYSALLITPKLGIAYAFNDQWMLAVGGFMNFGPVGGQPGMPSVTFQGLNGRLGVSFPAKSTWKTTFMFGVYTLRMTVSDNSFGFDQLSGPQILLAERKSLDAKNSVGGYVKASLLMEGSTLSFAKRELSGGLNYEHRFGSVGVVGSGDLAELDLTIGEVQIISRTLTFGLGLNL
jgi:hypothetical protein